MGRLGWATILGCLLGMFLVGLMLRGCNADADSRVTLKPLQRDSKTIAPAAQPRVSETGASARTGPAIAPPKPHPGLKPDAGVSRIGVQTMKPTAGGPTTTTTGEGRDPTRRTGRPETTNVMPRPAPRRLPTPGTGANGGSIVTNASAANPADSMQAGSNVGLASAASSLFNSMAQGGGSQAFRFTPSPTGEFAGDGSTNSAGSGEGATPTNPAFNPNGFSAVTGLPQSTTDTGNGGTGDGTGSGVDAAGLGAVVLQVPSQGATGITLEAPFRWTTATGATAYRIRVSTAPTLEAPTIDQSGLTTAIFTPPVGKLLPGVTYYWQVTASNSSGTRNSGLLSFTTGAAAPAGPGAFALVSPSANARGLTGAIGLSWGASAGAATYSVSVARDANFLQLVAGASGLATTSFQIAEGALLPGTDYFWRVTATNGVGARISTQNPSKFTTLGAPGAFNLLTPATGGSAQIIPVALTWTPSADAVSYRVEVALDSGFTQPVVNRAGVTTPSTLLSSSDLQFGKTYFWRVTAINALDSRGSSQVFSFSTKKGPGDFALVAPGDNASVTLPVTLDWEDSSDSLLYTVQVSESSSFTTNVVSQLVVPLISGSSFTVPAELLQTGKTYFWRVIAQNEAGQKQAVVNPFKFTTGVADYDVNHDGVVDSLDLYAYQGLNPKTDLNGDGVMNAIDAQGLRDAIRGAEPTDILARN